MENKLPIIISANKCVGIIHAHIGIRIRPADMLWSERLTIETAIKLHSIELTSMYELDIAIMHVYNNIAERQNYDKVNFMTMMQNQYSYGKSLN